MQCNLLKLHGLLNNYLEVWNYTNCTLSKSEWTDKPFAEESVFMFIERTEKNMFLIVIILNLKTEGGCYEKGMRKMMCLLCYNRYNLKS